MKEQAIKLQRDFAVLVRETIYDAEKDKFLSKLENINVIVGQKDAVEFAKKEIESFLAEFKGSFKTTFRVQAQ